MRTPTLRGKPCPLRGASGQAGRGGWGCAGGSPRPGLWGAPGHPCALGARVLPGPREGRRAQGAPCVSTSAGSGHCEEALVSTLGTSLRSVSPLDDSSGAPTPSLGNCCVSPSGSVLGGDPQGAREGSVRSEGSTSPQARSPRAWALHTWRKDRGAREGAPAGQVDTSPQRPAGPAPRPPAGLQVCGDSNLLFQGTVRRVLSSHTAQLPRVSRPRRARGRRPLLVSPEQIETIPPLKICCDQERDS